MINEYKIPLKECIRVERDLYNDVVRINLPSTLTSEEETLIRLKYTPNELDEIINHISYVISHQSVLPVDLRLHNCIHDLYCHFNKFYTGNFTDIECRWVHRTIENYLNYTQALKNPFKATTF